MAIGPEVAVKFLADTHELEKGVRQVEGLGSKLKTFAKVAAGALATVGVIKFGSDSVKAAQEAQVANKRLEAVYKSMGDKQGKAAKAAENYADKLSMQIGIEDEQIKAGQALLATFSNVSGEVGRAAGVFDRATKAGADMAAAGIGSITGNAIMLGKALQDPLKGVTKLTKAGVTFTDSQKKQIEGYVKSGNLLSAQKIILGEVEHQVSGTAAATATAGQKMAVAWDEVQERLGTALLPLLQMIGTGLAAAFTAAQPYIERGAAMIQSAMSSVVAWVVKNWPRIQAIAVGVFGAIASIVVPIVQRLATFAQNVLWPALQKVFDAVAEAAPSFISLFERIGKIAQAVWPKLLAVLSKVVPVIATIVAKLIVFTGWLAKNYDIVLALAAPFVAIVAAMKLYALYQGIVAGATRAWTAAQTALNLVMSMNPVLLVVAAIVALVAIIVVCYNRFDWFRGMIDAVWQAMQTAFYAIRDAAVAVFNWIKTNWPLLLAIITGPIGLAVLAVVKNWDKIKAGISAVFNWIKTNWPLILAVLTGPIGLAVLAIVRNWDTIKNGATSAWNWVRDKFTSLLNFFRDLPGKLTGFMATAADAITSPFRSAFNAIARLWNNTVGRLSFKVPSWVPGIGGKGFDVPDIPELKLGGITKSAGLAYLHPAEVITPLSRAAAAGMGNTYYINVEVPPSASPAAVGKATVDAIRAYEGVAGTSWRTKPGGRAA